MPLTNSNTNTLTSRPSIKGSGGTPPTPPPQPTPSQFVAPTNTGVNMTALVNAPAVVNTPYAGGQLGAFYDLNGDFNINILDVVILVNIILG